MSDVRGFFGDYRFLSNFYPAPVVFEGVQYSTTEHAYQAAKTIDPSEREYIRSQESPGAAKRAGVLVTLREGWAEGIDVEVMRQITEAKFRPGTALAEALLLTGDDLLVEANTWHDNHWGDCTCGACTQPGQNLLGVTLMETRNKIRREKEEMTESKELVAIDLGEDGNAWFVEGAKTEEEAKAAVSVLLDSQFPQGSDDLAESQHTLDEATGQVGRWWFATGRLEGQMVSDEEPPVWHEGVHLA